MNNIPDLISYPLIFSYVFVFIIIISALLFVVGVGLAMRSPAALRFYDYMHGHYSLRSLTSLLFMPHFIEPVLHKHLNLLGIALILGASTSIVVLLDIDADIFQPVFLGSFANESAEILAGYTKSFLLYGNIIGVGIGLLALFFPGLLSKIEAYTDKWYTLRKQTRPMNQMHPEGGKWVLAHPTIAGVILSTLSLLVGISIFLRI